MPPVMYLNTSAGLPDVIPQSDHFRRINPPSCVYCMCDTKAEAMTIRVNNHPVNSRKMNGRSIFLNGGCAPLSKKEGAVPLPPLALGK